MDIAISDKYMTKLTENIGSLTCIMILEWYYALYIFMRRGEIIWR